MVQETVVSCRRLVRALPLRSICIPAQELFHVIEGSLVVEIEGGKPTLLKTGEAAIIAVILFISPAMRIPAQLERPLVVHSRAAKDKPLMVVVKK